jgi:hypothetical protein
MKTPKQEIETIQKRIAEQAKAKKETIAHFKKGGTLADFKPKYKNVARPI